MTGAPIPLDTLLAHREWVRTVARAVVRDPNAADDVEQETWLAALSTPPRHTSSLRGWFGAVARSRARRIGRGESRRGAREIAASRDEATASAAEIAELADTHRRVVQAVVELDEPYRATILLRYFEGLSIEDVAARTASPIETTRSRIKRGVAKLRERLSKELGTDERPWAMALAPLIAGSKDGGVGAGVAAATKGGTAMAFSTKFAAVAAVVLVAAGVGAVVVPKWTGREETAVAAAPGQSPAPNKRDDGVRPAPPSPRTRAKADPPQPAPPPKVESKPRAPEETAAQKLGRVKLGIDWRETPLREALAEIASKTGVEIVLSAEASALFGSRPDDVKLDRLHLDEAVAAKQVLDLVTQLKGLAYVIEEPRVVIVPPGVTRDPAKPVVALPPWAPPAPVTVTGRVTDAAGVVIVGAEIVQVQTGERVVATTDVAGRYEAKLTKPYGSLAARAPWQMTSSAAAVEGQPGAQVTVDLATRGPAGSAAVHVVSAVDGAALANAVVFVGPREVETSARPRPDAPVQPTPWRRTDEKGAATFSAVAPGVQPVNAHLDDYVDFIGSVEVTAGKASPVLEIRLTKAPPLEERLAKTRISFNFSGARPGEIVKFINDAKQLNIVMDPALAMTLRDRTISLSVNDRPLDEALRTLCDAIGATYRVQGPVVYITAAKR